MQILFHTQRLYLRNLTLSDLDAVYAYRNDSICAAYQRWEDTSREAVGDYLRRFSESRFLSEQEEQHYGICTKEHSLAGELAYFYTREDNCVTLGITIAPAFQRQGIAREMLDAVIKAVKKQDPGLDVVALIHPENQASLALFSDLGFTAECYAESIGSWVYVIYGNHA